MLAIVIPFYKLTFFEATLQSLVNQTDKRFKVYIGDDASPESPVDLLSKFQGKFNFVYYRFKENLGGISLTKQWERCIALSGDEEWIMILGDDDSLDPNCVESIYNSIDDVKKNDCKVIRFPTRVFNFSTNMHSEEYFHPKIEKVSDFFYRRFTEKTRSSLSEYVFLRKSVEEIGFVYYNLAWHSDDRAWIDFSNFDKIYSLNECIVTIGLSTENISRGDFKLKEKSEVSYIFHTYILRKYFFKFKREQILKLLLMYEQLVYRNKKQGVIFFIVIIFLLNLKCYPIESVKFIRRYLIQFCK